MKNVSRHPDRLRRLAQLDLFENNTEKIRKRNRVRSAITRVYKKKSRGA